ncbi:MAG: Sec-independent protein translocase protein TatB [Actinomycetota bacterium]|nr:Sec-independent protein translocase protein TatB [Actinomycetota bacterium]
MNIGPAEIAVILLVALLVFGPSRLPEISRQVGGAMRELRKMQSTLKAELDDALNVADTKPVTRRATTTRAPTTGEPDHTDLPAPFEAIEDRVDISEDLAGADPAPDDGFTGPDDSFI